MQDYETKKQPWNAVRNQILSIEITEGITTIGTYSFEETTNLKTIEWTKVEEIKEVLSRM